MFLFAHTTTSAQIIDDTAAVITHTKTTGSEPLRFGIHAVTAYHIPLGRFGKNWNGYFTGGLSSDFSTYIPRMLLHFSVETGECARKNPAAKHITMIHSSLAVSYAFPINTSFSVRPRIGLLTSTIYPNSITFNKDFFADSESEFGVTGGIEPVWSIKRFRIGVPLSFNMTFSSPSPMITVNIALNAGAVF